MMDELGIGVNTNSTELVNLIKTLPNLGPEGRTLRDSWQQCLPDRL